MPYTYRQIAKMIDHSLLNPLMRAAAPVAGSGGSAPASGARRGPPNLTLGLGGINGFLAPAAEIPPTEPGAWQTYDITLEAESGPLYFQGDHHGGVRYRNITISLPRR